MSRGSCAYFGGGGRSWSATALSVQKAFCVLEYAKTQSFKAVQRAFAQRFEKTRSEQAPDKNHIWTWHKKFKEEGCLCTVKGSGRTPISEKNVEQIRSKLVNNPRKSIRRTSFETQIPKSTVWRIVIKRLQNKAVCSPFT